MSSPFRKRLCERKTVRRQQVEQGIFSISSNRGASGHAQTPALILTDHEVTEDAGSVPCLPTALQWEF